METGFSLSALAVAVALNGVIAFVSHRLGKLDLGGAISGFILGVAVYLGAGPVGFGLLLAFFIIGTAATAAGKRKKSELFEQQKSKPRSVYNVLANGLFAGLLAVAAAISPADFWMPMFAASLAAATADTVESELGVLAAGQPRMITSGRKVAPGTDGAVSIPGTLAGLAAALLIAALAYLSSLVAASLLAPVALAGFAATVLESIAASIAKTSGERSGHVLNLFNTGAAALIVWLYLTL